MQKQLWNEIVEALDEQHPSLADVQMFVRKFCGQSKAGSWDRDRCLGVLRDHVAEREDQFVRLCHRLGVPTPEERVQQAQIDAADAAKSSARAAKYSMFAAVAMVVMAVVTATITCLKDTPINVQPAEPKVIVVQPPTATQPAAKPEATTQPDAVP